MGRQVMRPSGWDRRLRELIAECRRVPFAWGSHDCVLFAFRNYKAMTGLEHDHAEVWTSQHDAARLLRVESLAVRADRWFGPSVEGWKTARRGDVTMIGSSRAFMGQPALAVVLGPSVACPGRDGLAFEKLELSFRTWRIG
jgi:hypothetical protein